MPRHHRHDTLDVDDLMPTWTPPNADRERQIEDMRELRRLSNQIAESYFARDDEMLALSLSDSLSRADIARATGLNKSRVDQIIREQAERYPSLRLRARLIAGKG
jgi:DNA-directed RNA polymerase specialized sigma subunit